MKKLLFLLAITLVVIGTISAQTVTVTGTLQLQNGQIVIASGNSVYFCPMITQYVGFIDGLKEGNNVTVEGFVYGITLQPTKLTVGGKSYDFVANNNIPNNPNNYYSNGYGYCGGYCGCGGGFAMGNRGNWSRCW